MNKIVKIAIISAAALGILALVLFVVVPKVTSGGAEARLGEAFAEAGIPDDMWSVGSVQFVPLFNRFVIENLEFGDRYSSEFIRANKVTVSLSSNTDTVFAGSLNTEELTFYADGFYVSVNDLSVNNFSIDKFMLEYSPFEAVKKLDSIRINDAVFRQDGRTYFSLGRLSASLGYTEGYIPLSTSFSLTDLVMDIRPFAEFYGMRPEYRLTKFETKSSISGNVNTVTLAIDGANLFSINTDIRITLPRQLVASRRISDFAMIDFEEDIRLNSFSFTYEDKSLLDHIFDLTGMSSEREYILDDLYDMIMMFAMMGGAEMERLMLEAAGFIERPGKLELRTNFRSPLSFEDVIYDPFAMNLGLSINGGRPFMLGGQ